MIPTQEDRPENKGKQLLSKPSFLLPSAIFLFPIVISISILPLPSLRQDQPILHATASLQHVRILRAVIALADHFRASQFELCWEARLASPLHVFGSVFRPGVCAAHHFDIVQAFGVATDAVELWYGWATAGSCLAAAMEGQSFDV